MVRGGGGVKGPLSSVLALTADRLGGIAFISMHVQASVCAADGLRISGGERDNGGVRI